MSAPRTLQDVAGVSLRERARVVRRLCSETDDVSERHRLVELAFLTSRREAAPAEDESGQLLLDVEMAS